VDNLIKSLIYSKLILLTNVINNVGNFLLVKLFYHQIKEKWQEIRI